jgi:hypothetical protein
VIRLSREVKLMGRYEFRTTKWCEDCRSWYVLPPDKLTIHCKCQFIPVEAK